MPQTLENILTEKSGIYTCLDYDCEWVGDDPVEDEDDDCLVHCPLCRSYVHSYETIHEEISELKDLKKRIEQSPLFTKVCQENREQLKLEKKEG